ncbi:MAG: TlpA family protein disulfide reductase [Caulobacteraceae bacterium]|nr:TlpA family protein disulfide reductase [Caulobacteraceae bacterium]
MSELSEAKSVTFTKRALQALAVIGLGAAIYVIAQACSKPSAGGDLKSLAKGDMAKLTVLADAGPAPATSFVGPDGQPVRLADFKGKVVVLNLWATWCAPCVVEMPTIAKLAESYAGQPVEVVAVSIDKPEATDKARAVIAKQPHRKFYQDPTMSLPFDIRPPAPGMPTTVIYGKDGVEKARVSGEADWSTEDARAVIDKVLAAP